MRKEQDLIAQLTDTKRRQIFDQEERPTPSTSIITFGDRDIRYQDDTDEEDQEELDTPRSRHYMPISEINRRFRRRAELYTHK